MKRGRPPYPDILTPREWEVLALVERGYTNDEVAQRLGVSIGGVKFHMTEILGKLHLSNRDEAARWHRQRFAPAPLWMLPLDWLRSLSIPARAAGAGAVMLGLGAVALGAWGLSRTEGQTVVKPEVVAAPGHLVNAKWMNNGEWILALDTDELRYKVVDRTFREVFVPPTPVACTGGAECVLIDARGAPSGTLVMAAYLDPRRTAPGDPLVWANGEAEGSILVWDAGTGEALQSFRIPPALPSLLDTVTRSREWRYFAEDGRYGWRNDVAGEIAPTSLLPTDTCRLAISSDGRFAVVRTYQDDYSGPLQPPACGPCRLIDLERNLALEESSEDGFAGTDLGCDNADWTPDGRTLLLSGT